MRYRRLGKSGLKISEVSLGTWLTFSTAITETTAKEWVAKAFELGINFFDTADVYALGDAERILGKALAGYPRESYVVGTKCFFPAGRGPNDQGLSRKHIIGQCNKSLANLNVDYIDLYQCHRYDPHTPLEETLTTLDDLIRRGKILYIGFSEWPAGKIKEAVELQEKLGLDKFVSSQPYYNILHSKPEYEIMPTCKEYGIGQIVFSPLEQGLLTGKYKKGETPPLGTRLADKRQNMFMDYAEGIFEKIEKLEEIAKSEGVTMAQLSLAWCLRREEVSSVICGARNTSQIEENARASGIRLSEKVLSTIEKEIKAEYQK